MRLIPKQDTAAPRACRSNSFSKSRSLNFLKLTMSYSGEIAERRRTRIFLLKEKDKYYCTFAMAFV